jgi:protein ImuB
MNRRIACVIIPNFPLLVQLRDKPELYEIPTVLAESGSNRSKVLYMNMQAAKEGVSFGITVIQAKNICPEVCVLAKDSKKEQQKSDELLRKLYSFSPFIEEAKPGIAYLDASGFRRTYPQEKDWAEELISFVRLQGYPAKAGMAGNKFTSLVSASISKIYSYSIVPDGKEKEFLKPQSIQLLPMHQNMYEKLYRLGIKTLEQFAILPDQEVVERFGSEGVQLLRLARGKDDEPLKPKRLEEKESQTKDLDSPLETQIGILFYVNSILEKQLSNLAQKGLACDGVLIILKTEKNNETPIHLSVAQGSNRPKTFIDLLRLELGKIILPAPVKEIEVDIQRTSPLSSEQLCLYRKKEANVLSQILTQLKRVLGNGNILTPKIVSSHKPEGRFQLVPYPLNEDRKLKGNRKNKKSDKEIVADLSDSPVAFSKNPISGLRLYNPPKPATVRTEGGLIKFVIGDSWYGEVVKQRGPWDVSGEWWSKGYDRSYFEIELSEGEQYLIFFETPYKRWFLQGIFD